VAGDYGAGDRNLLAGRHDHDLVGADVTDADLDLDALGPLARWWRKRGVGLVSRSTERFTDKPSLPRLFHSVEQWERPGEVE
jgi:hypothetical protein